MKSGQFNRLHFEVIHSTQDYFVEHPELFHDSKQVVVTANEQTKGRGTSNRMWASPPNVNIYATFGVKIPNELSVYFDLIKSLAVMEIMALAVVKTLEEFGLKPQIKWRNDVLINGKKICCILCEPVLSQGIGLVGIGLNVNMEKSICDSLDQPVTSMRVECGKEFNKEKVFERLSHHVSFYLNAYLDKSFNKHVAEINSRLAFMNQLVKVEDQLTQGVVEGNCLGIDERGQLKLKAPDKAMRVIRWGRIIKDDRKKELQPSKGFGHSPILYASGALGVGLFSYYAFNKKPLVNKPIFPMQPRFFSGLRANPAFSMPITRIMRWFKR